MHEPVYDLGDIEETLMTEAAGRARRAASVPPRRRDVAFASVGPAPAPALRRRDTVDRGEGRSFQVAGTLSLAVPGLGQMASGRVDLGLMFMTTAGFTAVMAWAIWNSLDRLAATLPLLDLSRAWGFRLLLISWGMAGLLHVAAVVSALARDRRRPPAPVLAIASALVPGWGQALAGRRVRAALFLGGIWLCGLLWLLASPPMVEVMAAQRLMLPEGLAWITGPLARFTAPAVLWAVAVSDALHGRDHD